MQKLLFSLLLHFLYIMDLQFLYQKQYKALKYRYNNKYFFFSAIPAFISQLHIQWIAIIYWFSFKT